MIWDVLNRRYAELAKRLQSAQGNPGLQGPIELRMDIIQDLRQMIRDTRPSEAELLGLLHAVARGAPYLPADKRALAPDEAREILRRSSAPLKAAS